MEVRSIMSAIATCCEPDTMVAEAVARLVDEEIGSLCVVRHERLVGILTDRDIVRLVASGADAAKEPVSTWMTPEPDTISADVEVAEAADWMLATGFRHLPVTHDERLLGIVSMKDVLWAFAGDTSDV